MRGEELQSALSKLLDGAEISGLRRLSGGASRETWSFDAHSRDGNVKELILRRDPPGSPKGMALESRLLMAAAKAGVPVPPVLASDDDPAVVGSAFIVMDRIEGETIARRILREDTYAEARGKLAGQCGEVLAKLHSIDAGTIEGLESEDQVQRYREVLDAVGEPHPVFELAFRWLEANRPPVTDRAVVHGDFRHGNLIVGPEGLRAVLDWELGHRGDPMEDLGWLCTKAWRFGAKPPVGGFGTYDQLIEGYESAGGAQVDRSVLHWWETLGSLKWGIMCIMQATAHTSGMIRSVELAAIGRRVCENEWDLLGMLA